MTIEPEDMDKLREQFLELALENVDLLREVFRGKKRINMQQVTLLRMVYAKVLPDISSRQVDLHKSGGDNTTMSRKALEKLVMEQLGNAITPKTGVTKGSRSKALPIPGDVICHEPMPVRGLDDDEDGGR